MTGSHRCECRPGFDSADSVSGVCKAPVAWNILFSDGSKMVSLNTTARQWNEVLFDQKRIESIDFDPHSHIVFWTDAMDMGIRRSYIPESGNDVEVGHAQNIVSFTKTAKPVALSFDWVAQNLYWLELDTASLKGQVLAAKGDGRYRRSVIPRGIDTPTSLAVNPLLGELYWSQAGSNPRIETSWMDGTKRKNLVVDALIHPTGLTIDFAMDSTIYWVDHSLNTIEMIKRDGSGRTTVIRGEGLDRPTSLDVFESTLYWVSTGHKELRKQDKFGRGVMVRLVKDITAPSAVKGTVHDFSLHRWR